MAKKGYTNNGRPKIKITQHGGKDNWRKGLYTVYTPGSTYKNLSLDKVPGYLTGYNLKPDLDCTDVCTKARPFFRSIISNMPVPEGA